MKIIHIIFILCLVYFSLENKIKEEERLLPEACEKIVDNFKKFEYLDKLDEAIWTLFRIGITDQYTETISKWLLAYQFESYKDAFIRIKSIDKEDYFRTAHYEYVTEDIFRNTIKDYL